MPIDIITVSMTRFEDFCASDPISQLSKVRETRRQHEQPYAPAGDSWSRWREQVETIHRRAGVRDDLAKLKADAKDNRGLRTTLQLRVIASSGDASASNSSGP